MAAKSWLCAALVCLAGFAASAEAAYMPVPWVFTDPKNDPFNPLRFIASDTLTAIAFCACLSPRFFLLRLRYSGPESAVRPVLGR